MRLLTHYDPDTLRVTIEVDDYPATSDDAGELFDAGVQLIDAAAWLTGAQNDRSRARILALHHEAQQQRRLTHGGD